MDIAFLGWGSLIWKPGSLRRTGRWHEDGPELPIEFARKSTSERVTLVIEPNSELVRTLWIRADVQSIDDAIESLRERENTVRHSIGSWSRSGVATGAWADSIGAWATMRNLDGVVWTALRPKWNNQIGAVPTIDELLAYLRQQGPGSLAENYIRKSPPQICTAYRRRIEAELGWKYSP